MLIFYINNLKDKKMEKIKKDCSNCKHLLNIDRKDYTLSKCKIDNFSNAKNNKITKKFYCKKYEIKI